MATSDEVPVYTAIVSAVVLTRVNTGANIQEWNNVILFDTNNLEIVKQYSL